MQDIHASISPFSDPNRRNQPQPELALEKHFTVHELSKLWLYSENTIRRLFISEPGVINIVRHEPDQRRGNALLRIPEHIALQVHRRLQGLAGNDIRLCHPSGKQPSTCLRKQNDIRLQWRKPPFSVYTRHSTGCKYARDKLCRRCNCPKWIEGRINHKRFRKSAGTRQWEIAEEYRAYLEDAWAEGLPPFSKFLEPGRRRMDNSVAEQGPTIVTPVLANTTSDLEPLEEFVFLTPQKSRVTVEHSVQAYMTDARSRNLKQTTIYKLDVIFRKQFLNWAVVRGLNYLDEIDLDTLLSFRDTWKGSGTSKQKKQDLLNGFFKACVKRGYISCNPTEGMKKIKFVRTPTDYFTREEFDRIIAATYILGDDYGYRVDANRTRLRTLTLLMRWSGLRIRDAVTLERKRLHKGSLLLYQAKTGIPVYVPLPPHVVEALKNIPSGLKPDARYFFWSGNGDPKTFVSNWQRSYRSLFELTGLTEKDGSKKICHSHMFRHTFAVEMLLAGVPLDQVSILLGHSSVRTTERSYAPFVKARQIQLKKSVHAAWKACASS